MDLSPLGDLLLKLAGPLMGIAGTWYGVRSHRQKVGVDRELQAEKTRTLQAETGLVSERREATAVIELGEARDDLSNRLDRMDADAKAKEEKYEARLVMMEGALTH